MSVCEHGPGYIRHANIFQGASSTAHGASSTAAQRCAHLWWAWQGAVASDEAKAPAAARAKEQEGLGREPSDVQGFCRGLGRQGLAPELTLRALPRTRSLVLAVVAGGVKEMAVGAIAGVPNRAGRAASLCRQGGMGQHARSGGQVGGRRQSSDAHTARRAPPTAPPHNVETCPLTVRTHALPSLPGFLRWSC